MDSALEALRKADTPKLPKRETFGDGLPYTTEGETTRPGRWL